MDLELLLKQCNVAKELIDMKTVQSLTEAQVSIVDAKMNLRSLQQPEYGPDGRQIVPLEHKMDHLAYALKAQDFESVLTHLQDLTIFALSKLPSVVNVKG